MSAIPHDTPAGPIPLGSYFVGTDACSQEQAIVDVAFIWSNADHNLWEKIRYFVPLDTNLYALSKMIEADCDSTISKHKPFLSDLYAHNLDVKGEARIWFPDGGHFANPTPTRRFRVEKLRDLFTAPELKKGQCVVPVRVTVTVIKKPLQVLKQLAELSSKTYVRHQRLLNAGSLDQSEHSTHSKMVQAHVHQHHGPCMPGKCLAESALVVLVREVNGMAIGSIDHEEASFPWHPGLVAFHAEKPDGPWYDQLPELPTMTLNEHIPINEHAVMAAHFKKNGQRIHLAIRLVNRIPSRQQEGVPLNDEKLPANVLMSVKPGTGQEKLICEALLESLEKHGNNDPDSAQTLSAAMFKGDFKPKWRMHLWIMPQTGSKKKLYLFKGGLANFMDIKEVALGKTTMYMEAHIAPKEDGVMSQYQGLTLVSKKTTHSIREDEDEDDYVLA